MSGDRERVFIDDEALAKMGGASPLGIPCPDCGCKDWRVYYTRPAEGKVKRMKICRNCGRKLMTIERSIHD